MLITQELSRTLPKESVLLGDEMTRPFECDALSVYRQKPLVVVLPQTIAQVKQIISICKKYQTPIVTRGAGTGLAGGALPLKNSVVLGLSKLTKVKFINPEQRYAVVEPGIRNIVISEVADQYNLYYAPDPSSQIACTIGGNVAENSGGVHCLKYGLTVHNILAIKILTIDGEEITFTRDDQGPGFLALMNGSEGLLGIIIEITVKLLPKPASAQVILAGFDNVTDCANAITKIITAGVIPAGLEMMDKFAIEAAEDFAHAGYPRNVQALILCELDGDEAQVKQQVDTVLTLLSNASTLSVSQNEHERLTFWKGRKSAFPAVGRLSPDYYCMDGTIPRRYLAKVLEKITALSQHYGLRVANVFHAGDGNLHPLILYDANKEGELEKTEKFGTEILKLCVDVGGSITGEHGVGIEKLDAMCHQFHSDELEILHQIKALFDPYKLLNPGKAVPTLHRCAELGAMHVHNGELPHSDLERF